MASVAKRPNGTYRARWRDPDGTERSKAFRLKADAENYAATKTTSVLDGTYIDPADSKITFGEFAETWRHAQIHAPATRDRTETLLRVHMQPTWEHRKLRTIRPSEVQAWVRGLSVSLAPATVESVYNQFATILRSAVDDRIIARSPCLNIQLPKREKLKVVPLEVATVEALVENVVDELAAALMVSACAGLRISEVLGLTVDRVDFLRGTITVDRQLRSLAELRWEFGPPKTRASKRVIPISAVLVDALAAHLAAHPSTTFVFVQSDGEPWSRLRAARALGVAVGKVEGCPEGTTWHDLRHFYASVLIAGGASVSAVQARLGHATAAETLDTYTHLFPAEDDRTRAVIEAAFRPSVIPFTDSSRTNSV